MQEIIQYQNQQGLSIREKLLYSALGLAVLSGGVYFGRKFFLNKVADKEESQSFEDGSSATTAKQIKMAFENDGWFGTNTTALRTALRQITSKDQFAQVQKSYQKLYNTNLLKDMADELQSTEYNEMLQIVAGKPVKKGGALTVSTFDAWAKRLKAAFDKTYSFVPGTDADAVVAVFNEIPTQTAFIQTALSYKKLYSANIIDDLKAEAEFAQYMEWMKIITTKPKGVTAAPPKKITKTTKK